MRGQSLIETLCVLLMIAVLCSLSVSALHEMQMKFQVQAGGEALFSAVMSARTEAIRRETRVSLCVASPVLIKGSIDLKALPRACASANELTQGIAWQHGWLIFEDLNHNGLWEAGETVIQRHAHLGLKVRASGNATVKQYVSFGASGRSLSTNAAFQAGTLTICEYQTTDRKGWLLVVNAMGRPRLESSQIAQCV